jgi:hypothetical protein
MTMAGCFHSMAAGSGSVGASAVAAIDSVHRANRLAERIEGARLRVHERQRGEVERKREHRGQRRKPPQEWRARAHPNRLSRFPVFTLS